MRADPIYGVTPDDPFRDTILEELDVTATTLTQRAARRIRLLEHENRRLRDEIMFQAERHQVDRLEAAQTIRRLRLAIHALDPDHTEAPKVYVEPAKGWWSNE